MDPTTMVMLTPIVPITNRYHNNASDPAEPDPEVAKTVVIRIQLPDAVSTTAHRVMSPVIT